MGTRRSTIPELKPGQWTQVSFVSQVQRHNMLMLSRGIALDTSALSGSGVTVQVFDYEPGPTELKSHKAIVARAVAAELDAASARAELTVAQQARDKAEQERDRVRRRQRENREFDRFLADVGHARTRLLTALLTYSHTWMVGHHQAPPAPLHELYADALRRPCPSYDVEPYADSGDPEEVPDPGMVGDPCVRAVGHEGAHSTVEGRRFDAGPLFAYLPLPGDPS